MSRADDRPSWDRRDFLRHLSAVTALGASGALAPERWPATPAAGALPAVKLPDVQSAATRVEELTLAEAATLLRQGELSPIDLVEACLARIDAYESRLQAFNHVDPDALRAAARASDGRRGGLHGIPLAIKDNFYTAGVPTTGNSHIYADFVPSWDSEVWRRLRERGALLVGKTQMGPLATSRATTPDGVVTTRNAWTIDDPDVYPGGSSSGSGTAVAAGLALGSTGTQTGGSITNPALAQGLTGLKPTMGRVSLRGIIPLTYTRDHPGPIVHDAMDAAIMLQAMAGPDAGDPRSLGLPRPGDYVTAATPVRRDGETRLRRPMRIGVMPDALDALSKEAEFFATMERLGATIVEIPAPADWDVLTSSEFNNTRLPERSEPFLPELRKDVRQFGIVLSSWINGLLLPGAEYVRGQRARLLLLQRLLDDTFQRCDVVIQSAAIPFDITGLPLIAFPTGFDDQNGASLPRGLLLGAPPCAEEDLLAVVAAWQDVTDWHRRRPDLDAPSGDAKGQLERQLDVLEVEADSQ